MKTRTFVAVALAGLVLAVAFLMFRSPAPRGEIPLPQPNGYDDLLRAAQMLAPTAGRPNDLGMEELKSLVAGNAAALSVARTGLQRPCRVPLGYSLAYATNHMPDLGNLKRLAQAFIAEGRLAEQEGRSRDAALSYLDTIRFGHECCRGGVIIDALVGAACRGMGCQALRGLAGQMKAAEAREAVRQLEDMNAKAEPVQDILEQERIWARRSFGWRGRIAAIVMRRSLQQTAQKTAAKIEAQHKTERDLLTELAELRQ